MPCLKPRNEYTMSQPLAQSLALSCQDVHLWHIDLEAVSPFLSLLQKTLSKDERQRANRFRFKHDRHRFTLSRGCLRYILGRYLVQPAKQIKFAYGQHGKPKLDQPASQQNLYFNISHSGDRLLCAVAQKNQVGVDIERIRAVNVDALARRFFLPSEVKLIQSVPSLQKQEIFFKLWVYKEAYLKATGQGISALSEAEIIDVLTQPHLRLKKPLLSSDWSLVPLSIQPEHYASALVMAGQRLPITEYHLLDSEAIATFFQETEDTSLNT